MIPSEFIDNYKGIYFPRLLKVQMLWPEYDLAMLVGDGFLGVPVIKLHTLSLASDLESQCSLGGICPKRMLGRMHVPELLGLDCAVGHSAGRAVSQALS